MNFANHLILNLDNLKGLQLSGKASGRIHGMLRNGGAFSGQFAECNHGIVSMDHRLKGL